jgi:hypothetical protein
MLQWGAWPCLSSSADDAGPSKHRDILIDDTLFGYYGLPRRAEWIVASFGHRRLIEAVLGIQMFIIEDRVG